MGKVLTDSANYTAIADAIREKNGTEDSYKPNEMANAILAIESGGGSAGLPESAYIISGNCDYRFANDGWNWFIREYGDKCKAKEITDTKYMFKNSSNLIAIPLKLDNFASSIANISMTDMFYGCSYLKELPIFKNCMIGGRNNMFSYCYSLQYIPEDFAEGFNFTNLDNQTSAYLYSSNSMFSNCYSLRKLPMDFINHGNPMGTYNSSIYYELAKNCYSLDEIVDLGFPHYKATYTKNCFNTSFDENNRMKNLIFKLQNDGTPYIMNWNTQTINLTKYVGYNQYGGTPISYGFTTATLINDDASYQALKDNPDSWATTPNYSRYNRISAVNTINSLPDTSAYLAANGGTNTIQFKGASGALTDGGAINTMTEEEIAVATAKGWTVSYV